MAMAIEGKSRHYLWHSILRRHWEETARRCGMSAKFESLVAEMLDLAGPVADSVGAQLPKGFPDSVASPILGGLRRSAARYSRGG